MDGLEFRSPPKRIILGNLNQNGGSPISPMANLKLLTKVATSHFSVGENTESNEIFLNKNNTKEETKPSRRSRSLSCICKKFLVLYKLDIPNGDSQLISLGNLATSLGIEKRRVYDIINIVSSLRMAVKVCKDKYNWFGNQMVPQLLHDLKAYALINKIDEQIGKVLQNQMLYSCSIQESVSPYIKIIKGDRSVFEQNKIGVLCQKFIMLFLVCDKDVPLNMCTISKMILSDNLQDKTGMRRLYDIANVLEALDLIKRYHCKIMKKPSFIYCGPDVNFNYAEYGGVISNELSCFGQQLNETSDPDPGNTNSDSSNDFTNNTSKLESILEVVCTEIKEENKNLPSSSPPIPLKRTPSPITTGCIAKKQLFPPSYVIKSIASENAFIKAPKRSFRLEFDELKFEDTTSNNNNNNIPVSNVNEIKSTMLPFDSQPTTYNNNNNFYNFDKTEENYSNIDSFSERHINNHETFAISINSKFQNKKNVYISKFPEVTNPSVVPKKIKILRPMKISDIKNGGVYKVLKNGNTMQFYAL